MSTNNTHLKEFTFLAVAIGIVIAIIMTAANVYLGLYAGMTVSASIPAAVIAMGVFKGVLRRDSLLESNIVQTMASAGESLAAGIIFTLPALVIIGVWKDFAFWPTTLIAIAGGLLGIIFMIPLRRALIQNEEDLTYPEGVACAAVLSTGSAKEGMEGFKTILKGLFFGGAFKVMSSGFKLFNGTVEFATKLNSKTLFFGFDVSAALLAVGYIVNLHVATLVFMGGALGFFVAIPLLGTPVEFADLSAIDLAWTLWSTQVRYLGVGAMIVGGVWSIISVRQGIVAGVSGLKNMQTSTQVSRTEKDLPLWGMMTVLVLCFVIMIGLYNYLIGDTTITIFTTILMIICSFLFVAVSSYIVGLVGSSNNPVSGMTISALLVSGALFLVLGFKGDSAILATLGVAAVVCCAACTAGDCSQDLKTGYIIGSTPRAQQFAQIIGVIIPAFVIAPVLTLLHETEGIGEGLKAPQASLFAAITRAMFDEGNIATHMVIYGAILGILVILIDAIFLRNKKFRLHLMPLAVGIYLPVTLAIPIFFGGLIRFIVSRKRQEVEEGKDKGVLLSSGFIAGEAIMGVLLAILVYVMNDSSFLAVKGLNPILREVLSIVGFMALASYLFRLARKN
ncbi:MAG: oligopeptide transporter, OPT family [Halobacteriovoraceae bacterium]|nr:oligopeptide transporter, OPT family [Halobacteriovoraceae bacterium]|tara:strand:- start:18824 stop:20683 length:1860 start_codon:yes stop_codon:yes gene_type:complete